MVQEPGERYEVVVKRRDGETVHTAHGTMWRAHMLGEHTTLVVVGGQTALTYGAMVCRAVDEVPALRQECLLLLDQNKLLSEGLRRVQGRCTDLLMEKRALRDGIKDVVTALNSRMESPDDIDASIVTDICDSLSDLLEKSSG